MLIFALFFRGDSVHFQHIVFYQFAIVRILLSLVHICSKITFFNLPKYEQVFFGRIENLSFQILVLFYFFTIQLFSRQLSAILDF